MGQPEGGFPKDMQKLVLKGQKADHLQTGRTASAGGLRRLFASAMLKEELELDGN